MAELTGNPHDRDSDLYRRVVSPHLYAALVGQAVTIARRCPVLVDAPFLSYITAASEQSQRLSDYIRTIADGETAIQTVWVSTDTTRIRERMALRDAERDRPKLDDWETYRSGDVRAIGGFTLARRGRSQGSSIGEESLARHFRVRRHFR